MPRSRYLVGLAVALLSSVALAQGAWFETGALTTVIDGEERLLHTYGTQVAEDVADGVEDPQRRALLERVAGTEQHTATYQLMDEVTVGPVVLVPATLWVELVFRHDGPDAGAPHGLTLRFPLDPATLELADPDEVQVAYFPHGPRYDDYYALTDGALTLAAVEVVDDVTLRISGSFRGSMSLQSGYETVHDPATAMEAAGDFVVEQVVNSQLALELLEGAE